jgi:L-asparagine transporter-like permease
MTSRTDMAVNKTRKIPWYVYFVGGVIYTVLAVMLFGESTLPVLAWICVISAPLGFYYAWTAWKEEKRNRADVSP